MGYPRTNHEIRFYHRRNPFESPLWKIDTTVNIEFFLEPEYVPFDESLQDSDYTIVGYPYEEEIKVVQNDYKDVRFIAAVQNFKSEWESDRIHEKFWGATGFGDPGR